MVADLDRKTAGLRTALEQIPDAITFGDVPAGLSAATVPDLLPHGLRVVLTATDGPRCGSVVLYAEADLPGNQFFSEELEGGPAEWLCFGSCDYVPLFVNRRTGEVWWSPDEDGTLERLSADVATFFDHYALGGGYADLTVATDDPWYRFLGDQKLVPLEES
jgi:hypothetical protein